MATTSYPIKADRQVAENEEKWLDGLYRAVYDIDKDEDVIRPATFTVGAAEKAMHGFSDRGRMVLFYRHRDGMTYAAIGKIFGVSAERVRQIYQKSLRRLRHPSRAVFFKYGEDYTPPTKKAEGSDGALQGLELSAPIEYLELPLRAYFCLKRRGVDCIGDIVKLTRQELLKTRNLGVKSAESVERALAEHGFHLSDGR